MKMFNFIRYGETDNTIVFDLSHEQREAFLNPTNNESQLMDKIYAEVMADPIKHIESIKSGDIEFTEMACIAGIIGGNLDESNGSGKSTLFEAMCYAIYDKIIRRNVNTDKKGSAGDSVAIRLNGELPESLSECYVEMLFEVNGNIYIVKRGRSFQKNKKTGLPSNSSPFLSFNWINAPTKEDESQSSHRTGDTTTEITKAVNMNYEVFVNSIMFGQSDAGRFLTGTDKTRKEMLVSALGADQIVTGLLKDIRDALKERKEKVNELQITCGVIEDAIGKYASVEDFEKGIKESEDKIKQTNVDIAKIDSEISKLLQTDELKEIGRIKNEASKVKTDLSELEETKESQIKEWREHYKNVEASIKDKVSSIEKNKSRIIDIETKISAKSTAIKDFDGDKCNKALDIIEKAKVAKPEYEEKVATLGKESSTFVGSIASKESDLIRIVKDIKSLQEQIDKAGDKEVFICDKCKSNVTRDHIENELKKNQAEQKNLEEAISNLRKSKKEIEDKLTDIKDKVLKLVSKINAELEIKTKIKNHEEDIVRLEEIKKDLEEIIKSQKEQEEEIKLLEIKKKEYIDKGTAVKKQYEDKIVALNKRKEELIVEFKDANSKAATINNKIEVLEKEKKELVEEKGKLDSSIGSQKQFIITLQNDKKKLEETQKELKIEEKWYARYLLLEEISGLEGIQTKIVRKWLPLLNIHIKEVLNILTQGRMNLELFINNKSAIDIVLTGGQADTFLMLSGGERMIVRLAVDISLGLLIFSRTANKAEMIVLDEIFGPLDDSKTTAVFELLQMLKDKFKRVLVISHKDDINKKIPHQIIIEKEPGDFGYSKVKRIV